MKFRIKFLLYTIFIILYCEFLAVSSKFWRFLLLKLNRYNLLFSSVLISTDVNMFGETFTSLFNDRHEIFEIQINYDIFIYLFFIYFFIFYIFYVLTCYKAFIFYRELSKIVFAKLHKKGPRRMNKNLFNKYLVKAIVERGTTLGTEGYYRGGMVGLPDPNNDDNLLKRLLKSIKETGSNIINFSRENGKLIIIGIGCAVVFIVGAKIYLYLHQKNSQHLVNVINQYMNDPVYSNVFNNYSPSFIEEQQGTDHFFISSNFDFFDYFKRRYTINVSKFLNGQFIFYGKMFDAETFKIIKKVSKDNFSFFVDLLLIDDSKIVVEKIKKLTTTQSEQVVLVNLYLLLKLNYTFEILAISDFNCEVIKNDQIKNLISTVRDVRLHVIDILKSQKCLINIDNFFTFGEIKGSFIRLLKQLDKLESLRSFDEKKNLKLKKLYNIFSSEFPVIDHTTYNLLRDKVKFKTISINYLYSPEGKLLNLENFCKKDDNFILKKKCIVEMQKITLNLLFESLRLSKRQDLLSLEFFNKYSERIPEGFYKFHLNNEGKNSFMDLFRQIYEKQLKENCVDFQYNNKLLKQLIDEQYIDNFKNKYNQINILFYDFEMKYAKYLSTNKKEKINKSFSNIIKINNDDVVTKKLLTFSRDLKFDFIDFSISNTKTDLYKANKLICFYDSFYLNLCLDEIFQPGTRSIRYKKLSGLFHRSYRHQLQLIKQFNFIIIGDFKQKFYKGKFTREEIGQMSDRYQELLEVYLNELKECNSKINKAIDMIEYLMHEKKDVNALFYEKELKLLIQYHYSSSPLDRSEEFLFFKSPGQLNTADSFFRNQIIKEFSLIEYEVQKMNKLFYCYVIELSRVR